MAIYNWGIALLNLTRVVKNYNLSKERICFLSWVILCIRSNETPSEILHCDISYIEPDIIPWNGLLKSLVVHLNSLAFCSNINGSK